MDEIRDLLTLLVSHFRCMTAIYKVLMQHEERLKSLEGYKLKNDAAVGACRKRCDNLSVNVQTINKKLGI